MVVPREGATQPPFRASGRTATGEAAADAVAAGAGATLGAGPSLPPDRTSPPTMRAMVPASTASRVMRVMVVDLQVGHGNGRRCCGVVSTAWRAAATARSGASFGPRSSQARAIRSKSRSKPVMPSALRERPSVRRPRWPSAAHASRSGVAIGPSRPGCRACRRSRPGAGPGGGAGRRSRDARRSGVGTRDRARLDRSIERMSSGPAGPSTGRTRTLAVHARRRLASA